MPNFWMGVAIFALGQMTGMFMLIAIGYIMEYLKSVKDMREMAEARRLRMIPISSYKRSDLSH